MKIAYLSTFYPFRGGIAQFNASLYRAFEKEHIIVKPFTFKRQYPDLLFPGQSQYVEKYDKADCIPSTPILDTLNPLSYFLAARKINNYQPDILLMKYWMSFFAPALGTVAKLMRKKTKRIAILDNVIPHEKRILDSMFTNYFLKQNDGFIAISQKVKQDLQNFLPHAKVLLVSHPVYNHFGKKIPAPEAKEKLGLDPIKKTILFFGFIRSYKGLDLLIKAFNNLDNRYELLIAGECYGSFENYQNQINNSKNRENIKLFNTYIRDSEVPYFFSASDVCVLPYRSATQSGITSIAQHFDLPIIATNVGGLKENINHEKNGLIVNDVSASALEESIKTYFSQDLKMTFAKNIREIKEKNSWMNFAKKIIDFNNKL